MNDEKSRNIGEILNEREDSCSPRNRCKSFLSFLFLLTARCNRDEPTNESCAGDSRVLESIIYMDRNGTCLSSILILGGVAGQRRGRRAIVWTIPYISRGRFMEIRSVDPLDTMIGGIDTIEIAAPVSYVSLPPSSIVTQKQ